MRTRGDKNITQRLFDTRRQLNIGMCEISENDIQEAKDEIERYRCPGDDHGSQSKNLPYQPVARMMAGAGGHINMGIAVMDHMEFPEPFELVKHIVRTVHSYKIQQ